MDARLLEEKIKQTSTLKLQIIKTQLVDVVHQLKESLHHIRTQKSTSKYFSTIALRKKLLQRLQEKLNFQESFVNFKKNRYQEISQVLKKIEEMEDKHQYAIDQTLSELKKLSQAQPNEIAEAYKQCKSNLIKALQKAASDYRQNIVNTNMKNWTKLFNQFSDEFGAVVYVNQSIYPYDLDFEHAYNLQFGHIHRKNKTLPILPLSIDLMHLSFSGLIDLVNKMIEECNYYKDDKALNYLEINLNNFLNTNPYFSIEKSGRVLSKLKKIILVKNDNEIIKILEEKSNKNLITEENKLSENLKKENKRVSQNAFIFAEPMINTIVNDIKIIQQEQKKCIDELERFSEALFYEMNAELKKFNDLYLKTKKNLDQAIVYIQRLNEIFESVLEDSLKRDPENLLKLKADSAASLVDAKKFIENASVIFSEMQISKNKIDSKMKDGKEIFSDKVFTDFELRNFEEFKKYESLKELALDVSQEYTAKCSLPDVLPQCAEISHVRFVLLSEKKIIQETLHVIEKNLNQTKTIFEEGSSKVDYHQLKKHVEAINSESNKNLEIIIGKVASIAALKESIDELLKSLKQKTSVKLYAEIQEIGNTAKSQYTLALSAQKTAEMLCQTLHNYTVDIAAAEKRAQAIEREKKEEEDLKTFILESILHNLDVWRVRGIGGGIHMKHNGIPYCVPHGIHKIISDKDKPNWVQNTLKIIQDRKRKKWSSFFRDEDTTGALYAILQKHLNSKSCSLETLQSEFKKIPKFKFPNVQGLSSLENLTYSY